MNNLFIFFILATSYCQVILVSDQITIVSHGTLTISNYPYNTKFPTPQAKWIWNQNTLSAPTGQRLTFFNQFYAHCLCKTFNLFITADNVFKAYVNGKFILTGNNWQKTYSVQIPWDALMQGLNTFVVVAENQGGPAALIYSIVAN